MVIFSNFAMRPLQPYYGGLMDISSFIWRSMHGDCLSEQSSSAISEAIPLEKRRESPVYP